MKMRKLRNFVLVMLQTSEACMTRPHEVYDTYALFSLKLFK